MLKIYIFTHKTVNDMINDDSTIELQTLGTCTCNTFWALLMGDLLWDVLFGLWDWVSTNEKSNM